MDKEKKTIKNIIKEIIIWFFEKYAIDYWAEKLYKEKKEKIKKNNNFNDEEVEEYIIEKSQEREREAYDSGFQDGINRGMENLEVWKI